MAKICNIFIIIFMILGITYLAGIAFFQIFDPGFSLNATYLGFIAPLMLVLALLFYLLVRNQLEKGIVRLFIVYIAVVLAMFDIIILYQKIGISSLMSLFYGVLFFAILGLSYHMIQQTLSIGTKKPE